MDENHESGFLGSGWSFPPRFDAKSGKHIMVSAEEDVMEALRILFMTNPGERTMHPTYGCGLRALVFEPMNAETESLIEQTISRAILFFEPRIELINVNVITSDWFNGHLSDAWFGGRLKIEIEYRIHVTNTRHNIVFPFYLAEGTLLSDAPEAHHGF